MERIYTMGQNKLAKETVNLTFKRDSKKGSHILRGFEGNPPNFFRHSIPVK